MPSNLPKTLFFFIISANLWGFCYLFWNICIFACFWKWLMGFPDWQKSWSVPLAHPPVHSPRPAQPCYNYLIYTYLESSVWGNWILSIMVFLGFHCESTGFAAAKMDVLALREQMIPALAMDNVCCSMTSWRTDLVLSFILSNSSIQQIPLSLSTRAPLEVQK